MLVFLVLFHTSTTKLLMLWFPFTQPFWKQRSWLVNDDRKSLDTLGHSREGVIKAILDKVYEIKKGGNSRATSCPVPDDDDESKKKKWFHGYIAFVLFGLLAPKENHLHIFCTGNPEAEGINRQVMHCQ